MESYHEWLAVPLALIVFYFEPIWFAAMMIISVGGVLLDPAIITALTLSWIVSRLDRLSSAQKAQEETRLELQRLRVQHLECVEYCVEIREALVDRTKVPPVAVMWFAPGSNIMHTNPKCRHVGPKHRVLKVSSGEMTPREIAAIMPICSVCQK